MSGRSHVPPRFISCAGHPRSRHPCADHVPGDADADKVAILRVVLDAVEAFGTPRFFRTDNEPVFASPVFSFALRLLGIRHRRTDRFCPWQNGRIERVFWTLKARVVRWWTEAGVPVDPQPDLDVVRVWYNHARTHLGLAGQTPFEAWNSMAGGQLRYFSAWNGLLAGFGRST